ncbi:MAG: alpha/beta fold hydrolase [Methyloceanibacter sp.]|nr:alpha/beta fold hydrolase [Methyloceanibacter sp.]
MADGEIQEFTVDLERQGGPALPDARLVYKTYGTLNAERSNAILFPTRFGGTHEQNEFMIGPGYALDPERYFIIVPNMFGNGVSSSPSNTPGPHGGGGFPSITIFDNVLQQHRLATEAFGIERFALVVGWSMGAQQAFQWAALFPQMVSKLACMCGTAKTTEHNRVFLESLRAAIEADERFRDGYYDDQPLGGLRAVGRIYAGWAYSQDWYRAKGYRALGFETFDDYITGYWDALYKERDANNIMAMTWTWIHNDISANDRFNGDMGAALGAITAKTLLMPCMTDLYFRTADSEDELQHLQDARLLEIPSIWGHMSGAGQHEADTQFIDQALKALLAS